MRTIKFRVWSHLFREMFTVAHLRFGIDGLTKAETGSVDSKDWSINDLCLMQFTGLLDRNGREVYEGDILADYRFPDGSKKVVAFGSYSASDLEIADGHEWEDSGKVMAWNINVDDLGRLQIIGNIYENPELMERC